MGLTKEEFKCLLKNKANALKRSSDIIIGIDPDIENSGVAELDVKSRKIKLYKLSFPDLMDYFQSLKRKCEISQKTLLVAVEAGWLNKGNWHIGKHIDTIQRASAIGNSAGRNHETGRKIIEMCRHYGLHVEEVKPLRKCWRGSDGKITAEEFKVITGYIGKSSQDMRDAGLIAWVYAGFPIRKC